MCLSAPGRVIEFDAEHHDVVVELDGRMVHVSTVPLTLDGVPVEPGCYVLVHTGFAVAVLDADEAVAQRRLLEEMR